MHDFSNVKRESILHWHRNVHRNVYSHRPATDRLDKVDSPSWLSKADPTVGGEWVLATPPSGSHGLICHVDAPSFDVGYNS